MYIKLMDRALRKSFQVMLSTASYDQYSLFVSQQQHIQFISSHYHIYFIYNVVVMFFVKSGAEATCYFTIMYSNITR